MRAVSGNKDLRVAFSGDYKDMAEECRNVCFEMCMSGDYYCCSKCHSYWLRKFRKKSKRKCNKEKLISYVKKIKEKNYFYFKGKSYDDNLIF